MSEGTSDDDDCDPMGLATDHAELSPVFAALESEGIPASAATIRQEHSWDQKAVRYVMGPRVKLEIRDARTWAMNECDRIRLDAKLQAAASSEWNGPDLVVLWRRPVAGEWADAWLDAIDRLWRDWRRRRVSDDAFEDAREAPSVRVWDAAEDHGPLLPRIGEILTEARKHPPAMRQFPPLPPDQVGMAEVMAVLRRIANGSAHPQVGFPANGWKHLWHGVGEFIADGWSIEAFKRNFGDEVRAEGSRAGWANQ
ncbi:hypothetical protein [Bradyrhizobium japonicum]|uniref:hypothetical protein n=1 Tax=Bradyrhizobium japonicum TaxID=375 RepID=UPI0004B3CC57|nr:hypothetical protein [Bradyrhizobium japonicum]